MHFWFVVVVAVLILAACEGSRAKPEATTAVEQHKPAATALPATPGSPVKSCEQRFTPVGMALTRAALDTRTGQQCRTAQNAPPAFKSLPMCADLLSRFPD
jgi:curli biogenesis system outer membrane secretion channel CsgG